MTVKSHDKNYKVYVFHRSYFSGKMLAYLRYKEIAHEPIYKNLAEVGPTLMANTGLRQMPVVETPDGKWLQDTTPMMEWFEQRYPEHSILSENPVTAFFTRLMEDYADEWLWRPAIYYRWVFPADRYMYKTLFVSEFVGGFWDKAKPLRWVAGKLIHKHQDDKFLFGDGITQDNRAHVESVYLKTLDRLEALFSRQPFLLGERPTMADFGFFGSMFWHFGNDPTPNRIMQERAPAVYEWVGRMWNAKASKVGENALNVDEKGVPLNWESLLSDLCQNYLPYLELNAQQFSKQKGTFRWDVEGYCYPRIHTSPYRVWCRERLQQHYSNLNETEQETVRAVLESFGGWESFSSKVASRSEWDPQGIAPLCMPGKIPLKHRLLARFTGTNHVTSRRAWAKEA